MSKIVENARDIEKELAWLRSVVEARLEAHFRKEAGEGGVLDLTPPDLAGSTSEYAGFVRHYRLSFAERLALALGLVPHVRPQMLDVFHTRNAATDRRFTEFGCAQARPDGELWPTGETLAFLLGGDDLELRFSVPLLFEQGHFFARHDILRPAAQGPDDVPVMKAPLRLSEELVSLFTAGVPRRPAFGAGFPAQRIETRGDWGDLVLHPGTRRQIEEIRTWMEHGRTLMDDWGMASKLRPGYRSLFHGPPGTGKTMTACLLGKSTGRDVYKVDISLVMSKYIGETEKNLAQILAHAEHAEVILLFDEADSLFAKRTDVRDANDRFANAQTNYLLQRIESFDGITLLTSNSRARFDEAFTRRLDVIVEFPHPTPAERRKLWLSHAGEGLDERAVNHLASALDLAGGHVRNIVLAAAVLARSERRPLRLSDVLAGVEAECRKLGKPVPPELRRDLRDRNEP